MLVTKTQRLNLGSVKRKRTWWCLSIGTWNVLSLYRPEASNILKQEVEKVQMVLVSLQEIRWLGNGILEKNGVILYSCNPVKHVFGVGFYVNSRFLSNILRFEPVNDRLC